MHESIFSAHCYITPHAIDAWHPTHWLIRAQVEIGHTLPAPGTEKKELRKAFKQADSDGDGYLTAEELRRAMDGMAGHGPLADDEFQIMLEECRRDAEIEEGKPIKIDHAVRFFLTS